MLSLSLSSAGGHCNCLRSVMWEFHQIDTDHSHTLNKTEVKVIDNNDMEPCLHPYLMTCDKNSDSLLSHHEWCCCFPQKGELCWRAQCDLNFSISVRQNIHEPEAHSSFFSFLLGWLGTFEKMDFFRL